MVQKLLWLSLAGAFGTVSRYLLCQVASKVGNGSIPVGTFAVNIIGSFLFGLIYVLAQRKMHLSPEMQVILLTGFMGAFTTFSAFAFETAQFLRAEQWALAFGNVFLQVVLSVLALVAGVLIARMI